MRQTEIEFFFPLTEQIPLDLDFSQCSPHQYWLRAQGIAGRHGPFPTGTVYIADPPAIAITSRVTLNSDGLTIKGGPMPWYRKLAYKIMGFKWND